MRVLHVCGWLSPRYGGTSEVVSQYYRALTARGLDIDIYTTPIDGGSLLPVKVLEPVPYSGVVATFYPLDRPRRFLASRALATDLWRRVSDYDVIHIHSLYRFHTIAASLAARHARVPYILQAHGSLNPPTRSRRRWPKNAYHWLVEDHLIAGASAVLCTSREESSAIDALGYRVPKAVIPLGVDVEDRVGPAELVAFRASHGIKANARIIAFLGRISADKGVDLLVDAFARIADAYPDAVLTIAGPDDRGIARDLLRSSSYSQVAARMSAIGTVGRKDRQLLLQAATLTVLPSAAESFGLAAAEAMAAGSPVVVTPGVAIQDVVRESAGGMVVDRSSEAIAEAVRRLLADPDLAHRMGKAAREAAAREFGWSHIGDELASLYASVARAAKVRDA